MDKKIFKNLSFSISYIYRAVATGRVGRLPAPYHFLEQKCFFLQLKIEVEERERVSEKRDKKRHRKEGELPKN